MPCLLCRAEKMKIVHEHAAGRGLWRCAGCGLLQTVPMPTDAELAEYYQRYDVLGEREPYYQLMWSAEALDTPEGLDVRERYAWAKKNCGSFGKTLDVGCGPGLFLQLAVDDGANAIGCELNVRAAERCSRRLGIKVYPGAISAVEEFGFDTITLWDLLEHVNDPVALVKECAARLKPKGWLFIETPDEASLLDRAVLVLARFGVGGPASTFYGLHHLVLFRRKTVRRLLEGNGFKTVEIKGAATEPGRIFRGNALKDKMTRLGLGGLFFAAKLIGRQNKMLIAARKE